MADDEKTKKTQPEENDESDEDYGKKMAEKLEARRLFREFPASVR